MIYIGPAVKIEQQERVMPVVINTCSVDDCENSRKPSTRNFCDECGNPVLPRTIMKQRPVSFCDFVNDDSRAYLKYQDDLFNPPNDKDGIWLPNRQVKDMSAFNGEIGEYTITVSDAFAENRAKQIIIFNGYYDKLFIDLRTYGFQIETVYVIKTYGF
jgi:hypothetical protein